MNQPMTSDELALETKRADREESRASIHANWSNTMDRAIEAAKIVCITAVVASVPVLLGRAVYLYNTHPGVLANTAAYDDMREQRDAALIQSRGLIEALHKATTHPESTTH